MKNTIINEKGLEGYLNDDKSLLEKRTFDEVNNSKDDFDNNRILKTKTTEFLDSKISDFFPETGYWNSHCFRKEKVVDKNNLPCHLRDTAWLAALIMKKYDLYSLGKGVVEEYVRDSLYFNKLRSEYEQRIVKWQINWMLNGGENWIVDPKYGSELVDFSPMYDYAFRKGIVDTLLAIGMEIEVIEEGIEKNADMWQVPIMNTAFSNKFNLVWYSIDSNERKLSEINPLFKENWLKYRKWKYYQEHKESVDKYGTVTEEMKMTEEEVKSLESYLEEQEKARLKEIEDFKNKKDIQEVPEIKVMSQSDFYAPSYEECLPKKNDSLDKPRGLKKIFENFFHNSH